MSAADKTKLDAITAVTFSTGLSGTTTITADVSTGKAGGQTWIGGTATGEGIILSSTSHATKGPITLGTSANAWTYNDATGRITTGGSTISGGNHRWGYNYSQNDDSYMVISNATNGTFSRSGILFSTTTAGSGTVATIAQSGTGYTPVGLLKASQLAITAAGAGGVLLQSASSIVIASGGATERMQVTSAGSVTIGTGLPTTATDGFLYVNSCAGVPTGVPTSLNGGNSIPFTVDRTNNKAYIYSGGSWVALN
jgi:hypothetical protein